MTRHTSVPCWRWAAWDKTQPFMRKGGMALAAATKPCWGHRHGSDRQNIVNSAAHIEATDASPEMIAEAKRDNRSAKLHFSVQDMFHLPYADESFDVVIVANALHIVPEPEKALSEIRRVLKDDGVLVAPTFTHADNAFFGKVKAFFMKLAGFPLHSRWTSATFRSCGKTAGRCGKAPC